MAKDLHVGIERSWIPIASSLAFACVAPCAGYLQDLLGRRGSLAFGMLAACVGMILLATSQSFVQSVAGSTIAGVASAIQELTAIAAYASAQMFIFS